MGAIGHGLTARGRSLLFLLLNLGLRQALGGLGQGREMARVKWPLFRLRSSSFVRVALLQG